MSYTASGPPVFNHFNEPTPHKPPFRQSESKRDRKNWQDKKKSKTYMKRFMAKHGIDYLENTDEETLQKMIKNCKTTAPRRFRQTPKNHSDPVLKNKKTSRNITTNNVNKRTKYPKNKIYAKSV